MGTVKNPAYILRALPAGSTVCWWWSISGGQRKKGIWSKWKSISCDEADAQREGKRAHTKECNRMQECPLREGDFLLVVVYDAMEPNVHKDASTDVWGKNKSFTRKSRKVHNSHDARTNEVINCVFLNEKNRIVITVGAGYEGIPSRCTTVGTPLGTYQNQQKPSSNFPNLWSD